MKSGWTPVTTLLAPRWYSKTMTQSDGCQWSTCPIGYPWRSKNYDATNREFVAILSALKRWRHYLLGAHFIVRSDHASLRWLQSQPQLSRR